MSDVNNELVNVEDVVESSNKTLKEIRLEFKSIKCKPNTKEKAQLIACAISFFFSIPFFFMIPNMFIFMNATKFFGFPIIFIIAIFTFLRQKIYYDVLRSWNEEFKNVNIKKLYLSNSLIYAAIIIGLILSMIF